MIIYYVSIMGIAQISFLVAFIVCMKRLDKLETEVKELRIEQDISNTQGLSRKKIIAELKKIEKVGRWKK